MTPHLPYTATYQRVFILLILINIFLLSSCAAKKSSAELRQDTNIPIINNGKVFRQKVVVNFTTNNSKLVFDGVLQLDRSYTIARVVALGAMTTLFDITVTPDKVYVQSIHPGMQRIPHLPDHIAMCVRTLWLKPLGSYNTVENKHEYINPDKIFIVSITTQNSSAE